MKCYKIINLFIALFLCTSILTINIINAEDSLSSIPISSQNDNAELPVLETDGKIYVSLDCILPFSDYVSNGDGTVLSLNNGTYHNIKIDYSAKKLSVGNASWSFSNLINSNDVWYFPLSEISAWINLNLSLDGNKLRIVKDPISLWTICNMYNFTDYAFDYTKEAGDNLASTSLIYLSYLTNTILNLKSNWSRLTRVNLADATINDYSTILERAILESNDLNDYTEDALNFTDTQGETGDFYSIYYSYLESIKKLEPDKLDNFSGIESTVNIYSTQIDITSKILDGITFYSDLVMMNEDYKDIFDIVYSSSNCDASFNQKKAASLINEKYSGNLYSSTRAYLLDNINENLSDYVFTMTPLEGLFQCTNIVNAFVSNVFPQPSNTWSDISLIPALTKTLLTNSGTMNAHLTQARYGTYTLEENEKLRLSAILYLRLCRSGYEMMKNAEIGSASYYQGIIDDIDKIVTQLHLARSAKENDSVDGKAAIISKYENILQNVSLNATANYYLFPSEVDKDLNNNDVLSRFNYLVNYVYRPGDIHYENKQSWPHGGYQCYGFAREVFYQLFGTTFSDLDTNKYYVFKENQSDIKNVKVIGQLTGNQITIENVKSLLSYAKVGDVIQMANGANNRYHHTMIVGRYIYDDGLEIYENNWSPYMTELSKHTWRGICNYTGSYSNSGITLYRATNYEDISGEIDLGGIYNPPSGNNVTSGNSSQSTNSNIPAEVSVAFENIYALQNSTNPLDVTFYCDKINASKIGTFSEWGLTVWQGNSEIATVKDQNQSWNEDHMSTWFNSLKYNISLKENTEYKFKFYVIFDNNTYYSDTVTYKTAVKQNSTQDNSNTNNTLSFSSQYAQQNGTDPSDVTFYCDSVKASAIGTFSEWGLTVWEGNKEIKTVKDTDQSWNEDHMNIWFNSKKYGISLKADTEYKYRFYVVYNNQTSYGDVQYYTTGSSKSQDTPTPNPNPTPTPKPEPADSVKFSNLYASQNGDNPLDVTFYCDSIKANKTGDFTEWGVTIWLNRSEVITVRDTNQAWREDHMNTWFNSIKYGINLSADTDYSFTFYVVFNGNKYNSDAAYFRTGSNPQEVVASKNVSFSNQYVSQNGTDPTDVTFYCDSVQANCLGTFSEWGVLIFDTSGNQIGAGRDVDQAWYEDHMNIWFNSKKYNIALSSGTNYQYQFFVIFDSKLYYSDVLPFTTNN